MSAVGFNAYQNPYTNPNRSPSSVGSIGSMPRFGGKILTDLEDCQKIKPELRQGLNPLQKIGVWLIENCYQRVNLKQKAYAGIQSATKKDICLFHGEGPEKFGMPHVESCSQFTKMAIILKGFFKGCLAGMKHMMSCNPLLFNAKSERVQNFLLKQAVAVAK